ncbi:hypothetical protein JCM16358_26470 [Halanaerocella petrolearia]
MFETNLKKKLDVKLLPMIDVMLFLVIFFMLFTTFKVTPAGMKINLPQARTVTEQKQDSKVRINITADGQLSIDKNLISLSNLKSQVVGLVKEDQDTLFIIKADKQVEYRQIVKVMDTIRQVGGHRLALAADKEEMN